MELSFLYTLQALHNPALDKVMIFFTNLGEYGAVWILTAILLLCFQKYRRYGALMLVSLLVTFLIGEIHRTAADPSPLRFFLSFRPYSLFLYRCVDSLESRPEIWRRRIGAGGMHWVFQTLPVCPLSNRRAGRSSAGNCLRPGYLSLSETVYEKEGLSMKTEFLGTCDSDSRFFCVGGKDLYQYRWNSTGRCVTVLHPDTKRTFTLSVYTVELDGETYSFASGAFPGGKTAFYEISD